MSSYEVEIKSLLGSKEKAARLRESLEKKGAVKGPFEKQLNHYFEADKGLLGTEKKILPLLSDQKQKNFLETVELGKDFSVRTRQANDKVIFVIKASVDDTTSANGISRLEFESEMNLALQELDDILLSSGLAYQAKWSREREQYLLEEITICLDKNSGYGYLAEFESVVSEPALIEETKDRLYKLMSEFQLEELRQDRLERMFSYYNQNWRDYYGSDKIFIIR